MTFGKLDLFPCSGEKGDTLLGSLEIANLKYWAGSVDKVLKRSGSKYYTQSSVPIRQSSVPIRFYLLLKLLHTIFFTPWPQFTSKLFLSSNRSLSAK
jgi:hypothetical protein